MTGYCDAHNHLQDHRFGADPDSVLRACETAGITSMVVNGSCEEDWPPVELLGRTSAMVIPSFGYHPWYISERSAVWLETLVETLDRSGGIIGEIGLDRWRTDENFLEQQEVFIRQLRLARRLELPVSIHCLKAWGKMLEILKSEPLPKCGFLLHSFGGPKEMVDEFVRLGGYFSFPGYFAHERKSKQQDAFRAIPLDRLLIETDAPDQLPPDNLIGLKTKSVQDGSDINHPVNLVRIYSYLAELLGVEKAEFKEVVANNFNRLFFQRATVNSR